MKRALAALGETASFRVFAASPFPSTLSSAGDKDFMCITPEPAQQPLSLSVTEKKEGRVVQEQTL